VLAALEIDTPTNPNGVPYYSNLDGEGNRIYAFAPEFEDIWSQEDEDYHNGIHGTVDL